MWRRDPPVGCFGESEDPETGTAVSLAYSCRASVISPWAKPAKIRQSRRSLASASVVRRTAPRNSIGCGTVVSTICPTDALRGTIAGAVVPRSISRRVSSTAHCCPGADRHRMLPRTTRRTRCSGALGRIHRHHLPDLAVGAGGGTSPERMTGSTKELACILWYRCCIY